MVWGFSLFLKLGSLDNGISSQEPDAVVMIRACGARG